MFGETYRHARERFSALVDALDPETLGRKVPATPLWTIKDLTAHVVGVARDMTTGNVSDVGEDAWTEAHVAAGRERSIAELLDEWATLSSEQVEGALDLIHPAVASMTVADLVTHELDLRGALGNTDERNSDGVMAGLDAYVRWMGRRMRDSDVAPLRFTTTDGGYTGVAGKGEPAATVSGSAFELFRALAGRRSRAEIKAFDWDGEAAPYVELFTYYSPPERSLDE